MKSATILVHNLKAGILQQDSPKSFSFTYDDGYTQEPVSLTMPVTKKCYTFTNFPPFFEGLLPEGIMLEGLLKINKIDKNDYLSQLIAVGNDVIGAVTIKIVTDE
jgi:serine/threonine-protein kinase HipA